MNERTEMNGVREYSSGASPELLIVNDRPVIFASCDYGDQSQIDLLDLIAWLKANRPDLLEGSPALINDACPVCQSTSWQDNAVTSMGFGNKVRCKCGWQGVDLLIVNDRPVIFASCDYGDQSQIDLLDLIAWLKANRPDLLEGSPALINDACPVCQSTSWQDNAVTSMGFGNKVRCKCGWQGVDRSPHQQSGPGVSN